MRRPEFKITVTRYDTYNRLGSTDTVAAASYTICENITDIDALQEVLLKVAHAIGYSYITQVRVVNRGEENDID